MNDDNNVEQKLSEFKNQLEKIDSSIPGRIEKIVPELVQRGIKDFLKPYAIGLSISLFILALLGGFVHYIVGWNDFMSTIFKNAIQNAIHQSPFNTVAFSHSASFPLFFEEKKTRIHRIPFYAPADHFLVGRCQAKVGKVGLKSTVEITYNDNQKPHKILHLRTPSTNVQPYVWLKADLTEKKELFKDPGKIDLQYIQDVVLTLKPGIGDDDTPAVLITCVIMVVGPGHSEGRILDEIRNFPNFLKG